MNEQFPMSEFFPPIHPEGKIFVYGGILGALLGFLIISDTLGALSLLFTVFCLFFFRDPARRAPSAKGVIVSPADGRVCGVSEAPWPAELGGDGEAKRIRISIFLSVLDVHVNRSPAAGTIKQIAYVPGKMLNANLDKASEENERNLVHLELDKGGDMAFVQISGFVARRIICDVHETDTLRTGERFGIIRFGSRMDVYLPEGYGPSVGLGQIMVGGETLIAQPTRAKKAPQAVPIAVTRE